MRSENIYSNDVTLREVCDMSTSSVGIDLGVRRGEKNTHNNNNEEEEEDDEKKKRRRRKTT